MKAKCEYCSREVRTEDWEHDGECRGCGAPLRLDEKKKKPSVVMIDNGGPTILYRYVGTDYSDTTHYDSGVRISAE